MSRLIDADIMRDEWLYGGENEYVYDANSVLDSIDSQPTVNAVELPCNVGDTVYDIAWNRKIRNCKISMICQGVDRTWKIHISPLCGGVYGVAIDAIGKTVYLTREEAEAALAKMDK